MEATSHKTTHPGWKTLYVEEAQPCNSPAGGETLENLQTYRNLKVETVTQTIIARKKVIIEENCKEIPRIEAT